MFLHSVMPCLIRFSISPDEAWSKNRRLEMEMEMEIELERAVGLTFCHPKMRTMTAMITVINGRLTLEMSLCHYYFVANLSQALI